MTEEQANKKVLQYKHVAVTNRELHILRGPRFLNDIIIEFYFLHLSDSLSQSHQSFGDDILLVSPTLSFFLQDGKGDSHISEFVQSNGVSNKQVVMFTVNDNQDGGRNDGGTHWSLLVYYRKQNTFVHYDSLGTNESSARKLYQRVKKHVATPADRTYSSSSLMKLLDADKRWDAEHRAYSSSSLMKLLDIEKRWEAGGDAVDTIMTNGGSTDTSTRIGQRCTSFNWDDFEKQQRIQRRRMRRNREQYVHRMIKYNRSDWSGVSWNREMNHPWFPKFLQGYFENDFVEERSMPRQTNFYDCGLYVIDTARAICEWYYLDDEAKQQPPEPSSLSKFRCSSQFPVISKYVNTSVESEMRPMILAIIEKHALESGIVLHLDCPQSTIDDESSMQFGVPAAPSKCKRKFGVSCYVLLLALSIPMIQEVCSAVLRVKEHSKERLRFLKRLGSSYSTLTFPYNYNYK